MQGADARNQRRNGSLLRSSNGLWPKSSTPKVALDVVVHSVLSRGGQADQRALEGSPDPP